MVLVSSTETWSLKIFLLIRSNKVLSSSLTLVPLLLIRGIRIHSGVYLERLTISHQKLSRIYLMMKGVMFGQLELCSTSFLVEHLHLRMRRMMMIKLQQRLLLESMIWSLPLGPPFPMMPKISYRNVWHTISKTECMPPTFWNINGSRELPAPSSTPSWWNKHLWACLSSMQTRSFSKPLWQWWLKIWLQKQKLPNSKKCSMNLTRTKMANSNTMSSLAAIKSSMGLITPRKRSIESLI